jgi:hypothetical protein
MKILKHTYFFAFSSVELQLVAQEKIKVCCKQMSNMHKNFTGCRG